MNAQPPPRRPVVCEQAALDTAHEGNIDRRECHRVVPMQVLCLGLSRTGTSSMRQALLDLGYSDVYHYASIINENPRDAEMWVEAIKSKCEGANRFEISGTKDWDKLLGHCAAVTDTPCAMFYKELLAAYPDAKVVLTIRDSPTQWWESQMGSVMKVFDPPNSAWQRFKLFFLPPDAQGEMLNLILKHYPVYSLLMADKLNGTREAMAHYGSYTDEIKRIVPADRLLVMNVKEGWGPLCEFLGKNQPHWAWPRVNERQTFVRNLGNFQRLSDRLATRAMYKSVGKVFSWMAVAGIAFWLQRQSM